MNIKVFLFSGSFFSYVVRILLAVAILIAGLSQAQELLNAPNDVMMVSGLVILAISLTVVFGIIVSMVLQLFSKGKD